MSDDFDKVIESFVGKAEAEMLNISRDAIQEVIEEAQTPVAKGGKMRVDTGFLRSSGVSALNKLPTGPGKGRKRGGNDPQIGVLPEYKMNSEGFDSGILPNLAKMKLGDKFFFGWTARYASVREVYDGFLVSATDKWNEIVKGVIKK